MASFTCSVCGAPFELSDEIMARYPNWQPKYCRKHSPRKNASGSAQTNSSKSKSPQKAELDLPVAEVLRRFSAGPQTGIFTDGSARPNPGPGGWGVVKVSAGAIVEQRYGSDADTTNNRMELSALIQGFEMLKEGEALTVFTDSELCVNIITKWAAGWEKNAWKRKTGPIKNLELVQRLYTLTQKHPQVELRWIEAHNGWLWNEYADSLATAWARTEL